MVRLRREACDWRNNLDQASQVECSSESLSLKMSYVRCSDFDILYEENKRQFTSAPNAFSLLALSASPAHAPLPWKWLWVHFWPQAWVLFCQCVWDSSRAMSDLHRYVSDFSMIFNTEKTFKNERVNFLDSWSIIFFVLFIEEVNVVPTAAANYGVKYEVCGVFCCYFEYEGCIFNIKTWNYFKLAIV